MLSIETEVSERAWESGIEYLELYFSRFKPSYMMATSPDFNPNVLEYTLTHMFSLLECKNNRFCTPLHVCLKHWIAVAVSVCPREFMEIIQSMFDQTANADARAYLVGAFAKIIEKLDLQEQVKMLPIFQRFLMCSPISVVADVPTSVWKLMVDEISEDEISALLVYLTNAYSVEPGLILTRKNMSTMIPMLLLSTSMEYVMRFLHEFKASATTFDIIPLVARAVDIMNLETCQDQRYAVNVLHRLLDFVDDESAGVFQPAWKMIDAKLDDVHCNYHDKLMRTLVKAEGKGVYAYEKLEARFEMAKEECQKYILKALLRHDGEEKARAQLFDLMMIISMKRSAAPLAAVIRCLKSKFDELREFDAERTDRIYERLFTPLPVNSEPQEALAELLLTRSVNVTTRNRVSGFIEFCTAYKRSEKMMELLYQLGMKFGVNASYAKVDWFGDNNDDSVIPMNLTLVSDHDPGFVLDLLACHVVDPCHAKVALAKLSACAEVSAPLVFNDLIVTLIRVSSIMGGTIRDDLTKLNIELPEINIPWFCDDQVRNLFDKTDIVIEHSSFGCFVKELLATTAKIAAAFDLIPESTCAILILVCRRLGTTFPGPTAAIVSLLHDSMSVNGEAKNKEWHANEEQCFFRQFLPMTDSVQVSKAIIHCYGDEKAFDEFNDVILNAMSKCPLIAGKFQARIDQPLHHMKTFVYFTHDKHREWVQECRCTYRFNEWIVSPGDAAIIGDIPTIDNVLVLDELHQTLYQRASDPDSVIEPTHVEIVYAPPAEYVFEPISNLKKGVKVRESNEDDSLYSVISYLWHCSDPLPASLSLESLQDLAFENVDDPRVLIAFFTTVKKCDWKIDAAKWASALNVDGTDRYSIYAASLFLDTVKIERVVPDYIQAFVNRSLDVLGLYEHDARSVINYIWNGSGMTWQFVKSVVAMDMNTYSQIDPLVSGLFMDSTNAGHLISLAMSMLSSGKLKPEDIGRIVGSLSSAFMFCPAGMLCNDMLPTNYEPHQRLMAFTDTTEMQKCVFLGTGIVDGLVMTLKKCEPVTTSFMSFMLNLASTQQQYEILTHLSSQHCGKDQNWSRIVIVHRDEYMDMYEVLKLAIVMKPPSFTRGCLRGLWKYWKGVLVHSVRVDVYDMLTEVPSGSLHPAFCFAQLHKVGVTPAPFSIALTKLRLGYIDRDTITDAYRDMRLVSHEAIEEFKCIAGLTNEDPALLKPWDTREARKLDFAKILLATAVSRASNAAFADAVFQALIQSIPLMDFARFVVSPDFMNRGKISCVNLIFRKLEATLVKREVDTVVAECMKFHNPSAGIIKDQTRLDILLNPDSESSVLKSLRYDATDEAEMWMESPQEESS